MGSSYESKPFFSPGTPERTHDPSSLSDAETADLSCSDLWNSASVRTEHNLPAETERPRDDDPVSARANRRRLITRITVALSLTTLVAVLAGASMISRARAKGAAAPTGHVAMIEEARKDEPALVGADHAKQRHGASARAKPASGQRTSQNHKASTRAAKAVAHRNAVGASASPSNKTAAPALSPSKHGKKDSPPETQKTSANANGKNKRLEIRHTRAT